MLVSKLTFNFTKVLVNNFSIAEERSHLHRTRTEN